MLARDDAELRGYVSPIWSLRTRMQSFLCLQRRANELAGPTCDTGTLYLVPNAISRPPHTVRNTISPRQPKQPIIFRIRCRSISSGVMSVPHWGHLRFVWVTRIFSSSCVKQTGQRYSYLYFAKPRRPSQLNDQAHLAVARNQ